jgi:hypothetical protein
MKYVLCSCIFALTNVTVDARANDKEKLDAFIQKHREIRLGWEKCVGDFAKEEAMIIDKTNNEIADGAIAECKSYEERLANAYKEAISSRLATDDKMADNLFRSVLKNVRRHAIRVVLAMRGSGCDREVAPESWSCQRR